MSRARLVGYWAMVTWCLLAGVAAQAEPAPSPFAVTTSWLECCLRDLAGQDVSVTRLCAPGTCPGHFDLTPGSLTSLRQCRLLFLFDFQKSLEEKLSGYAGANLEISPIEAPEGLCMPSCYLAACQSVHDVLAKTWPDQKSAYDAALERTQSRLAALERDALEQVEKAGLKNAKVAASKHQAAFCRWLGLDVVAAFAGGDSASPAALQTLVADAKKARIVAVIANLQEGRQFGDAIAAQVDAPLAVFSNFPSMKDDEATFDALVRHNLEHLLAVNPK